MDSMSRSDFQLLVGCDDWCALNDNEWYPDDLPVEWRMAFYANEFECCCVDLNDATASSSFFQQELDDLDENFRLSVIVRSADYLSSLRGLLQENDYQLFALIFDVRPELSGRINPADYADLAQHTGRYNELSGEYSVNQDSVANSLIQMSMPDQESLALHRRAIESVVNFTTGRLQTRSSLLMLYPATTSRAKLFELRQLVELMGL